MLILGHAENIGDNSELFDVMGKKHRLFRKKPGMDALGHVETTLPTIKSQQSPRGPQTRIGPQHLLDEANRLVLDRYAPPSVLIDENLNVVRFSGQTGSYFEPSRGEPSFNVLKLAREGLLHELRTALQASRTTQRPVRREGIRVRNGGEWQTVNIEVMPLLQQNRMYQLVLFEAAPYAAKKEPPRLQRKGTNRNQRLATLEAELAATREYLQSTIQVIEAANEELQSANEEILSSNEELRELTRVNADLLNLLTSVEIAIVIVSRDLRIRRFTPMAEKKFNLIPTDVGRPFLQISTTLQVPDFSELISETIETVSRVERTVQDDKSESYLLRISPYKTPDNRIDGAVIALFDVGVSKD